MELQYRGFTIVASVAEIGGTFSSSLKIFDELGASRGFSDIGRFASANAASNFVFTWAIALLDQGPLV